jgi:hypothetical protein
MSGTMCQGDNANESFKSQADIERGQCVKGTLEGDNVSRGQCVKGTISGMWHVM